MLWFSLSCYKYSIIFIELHHPPRFKLVDHLCFHHNRAHVFGYKLSLKINIFCKITLLFLYKNEGINIICCCNKLKVLSENMFSVSAEKLLITCRTFEKSKNSSPSSIMEAL